MAECKKLCMTNVVDNKTVKEVQGNTLRMLKEYLSKTFGPMGSYTEIISGAGSKDSPVLADYSKDGLKVLKHIIFDSPIEYAIQSEIRDECEYVEKKVGDGTTSTVILSSLIFDGLLKIMEETSQPPRVIVKEFQKIVNQCQDEILKHKRDITLDDIFNISMISTNGNDEVSHNIKDLYEKHGFDVSIDVDISNDQYSKIKTYEGLTINQGYSDAAYINNPTKGTAEIHNPRIYAFQDPIDTPEMNSFMEKIILENIINPGSKGEDLIPTVIVAPMIGRDGSGILTSLISLMYKYNTMNNYTQKPPIVIITNLAGINESLASDIERICKCKIIRKYINADIQKADQEKGDAPTIDTIVDFYGTCEEVVADSEKSMFINPEDMLQDKSIYNTLLEFLKAELKNSIDNNEDIVKIGTLKRRIKCLEANLVEYFVGGITISDRNALKDLVEDAVKNCASASIDGVGRAANFEGLNAITDINIAAPSDDSLTSDIKKCIYEAYREVLSILYNSVTTKEEADKLVDQSIRFQAPYNLSDILENGDMETNIGKLSFNEIETGHYNNLSINTNVLCSIDTDIEILNAISKIITMMVTSNQCLLQSTTLNQY